MVSLASATESRFEQHLNCAGDLEEWLKQMWDQALKLHPLPPGCAIDDSPELLACRYSLIPCVGPSSSADSAGTQRGDFLVQVPQNAHSCTDGASLFQATLKTNNRMTGHDWSQDVRHLEFEATQLPAALKAGDIASVWPQSPPQLVQRLCTRLGADPKIRILTVSQTSSSHAPKAGVVQSAQSPAFAQPPQGSAVPTSAVTALPSTLTVESLFSNFIDIAGVPRRSCFEQLSFFSHGNPEEAEKLREISGPAGADLYASYAKKEKRNIVEILEDFKSVQVPISFLLELLPPIAPRHFSIASSPTLDSGKLHLCMAVVQYKTPFKRNINGLCSTWLAHMTEGTQLTMCVRPGLLRLPSAYSAACTLAASASTAATAMQAAPPMPAQLPPFILIGPGTGVAPMRGMLRELQAAGPPSRGHSSAWDARLYFGCRKAAEDHLYADEWQAMQASGTLAVYRAAFSRDGPTKVYVQTLLWEDREAVAAALQHPQCSLFIAGNAKRMPTDVLAVLQKIIEAAGATEMQAKAHLALMQREQRLVIEAWS